MRLCIQARWANRTIRAASAVVSGTHTFAEHGFEAGDRLDVMDKFVALTVGALELSNQLRDQLCVIWKRRRRHPLWIWNFQIRDLQAAGEVRRNM